MSFGSPKLLKFRCILNKIFIFQGVFMADSPRYKPRKSASRKALIYLGTAISTVGFIDFGAGFYSFGVGVIKISQTDQYRELNEISSQILATSIPRFGVGWNGSNASCCNRFSECLQHLNSKHFSIAWVDLMQEIY